MSYIYIPEKLRWTITDINDFTNENISVATLIGIHYAYYKDDPYFEGGLNLFDLLYKKLHVPYKLEWNIDILKNIIRFSKDPCQSYMDVLNTIITNKMIADYGF
jgi:hypothetical protein